MCKQKCNNYRRRLNRQDGNRQAVYYQREQQRQSRYRSFRQSRHRRSGRRFGQRRMVARLLEILGRFSIQPGNAQRRSERND